MFYQHASVESVSSFSKLYHVLLYTEDFDPMHDYQIHITWYIYSEKHLNLCGSFDDGHSNEQVIGRASKSEFTFVIWH